MGDPVCIVKPQIPEVVAAETAEGEVEAAAEQVPDATAMMQPYSIAQLKPKLCAHRQKACLLERC